MLRLSSATSELWAAVAAGGDYQQSQSDNSNNNKIKKPHLGGSKSESDEALGRCGRHPPELGFIPRLTIFPLLRVLGETTQGETGVADTHN